MRRPRRGAEVFRHRLARQPGAAGDGSGEVLHRGVGGSRGLGLAQRLLHGGGDAAGIPGADADPARERVGPLEPDILEGHGHVGVVRKTVEGGFGEGAQDAVHRLRVPARPLQEQGGAPRRRAPAPVRQDGRSVAVGRGGQGDEDRGILDGGGQG